MDDHTVTGRVMAVLDAVAAHGHPVTLADLTRAIGIPKPTARRIAADLVSRQMLERGTDGRYQLGTHLLELGLRAAEQHGLREAAAPYIQDLFARTREVAWINLLTPTAFTLVDVAFGANRRDDVRRNGWPTDLRSAAFLATAAGRILFADRPDLGERLRARPLPRLTPKTIASWPQLGAALQVVRDTGTAIEHEQLLTGYSCIAAGLRSPNGTLIGTIGVTGRTGGFDPNGLTRTLHTAASNITRTLTTNELRTPAGGRASDPTRSHSFSRSPRKPRVRAEPKDPQRF